MNERLRNIGLLVMRLGAGALFIGHGWPKMSGGPAMWERIGRAMGNLGLDFAPTVWGFLAAFAEFGGGILIAMGLLTRPAAAMMAFTMVVAIGQHAHAGDGFNTWSHAALGLALFVGLAFTGAGELSVDALLKGRGRKR